MTTRSTRPRRWRVGLVALAFLLAACGDEGETAAASPYFTEAELDLSSPRAAVEELITAQEEHDFLRAMLILSPDAQRYLFARERNLNTTSWLRTDVSRAIPPIVEELEHTLSDETLRLHRTMSLAAEEDLLLVDLRGATVDAERSTGDSAQVDLVLEGTSLGVADLELVNGRWRVAQVAVGGGELDPDGGVFIAGGVRAVRVRGVRRNVVPFGRIGPDGRSRRPYRCAHRRGR